MGPLLIWATPRTREGTIHRLIAHRRRGAHGGYVWTLAEAGNGNRGPCASGTAPDLAALEALTELLSRALQSCLGTRFALRRTPRNR